MNFHNVWTAIASVALAASIYFTAAAVSERWSGNLCAFNCSFVQVVQP